MNRRMLLRSIPAAIVAAMLSVDRKASAEPVYGEWIPGKVGWVDAPAFLPLAEFHPEWERIRYPVDLIRMIRPRPTIVETEHGKAWQYDYTFGAND